MRKLIPLAAALVGACSGQPAATGNQVTAAADEPPPPATPAERSAVPEPAPSPSKAEAPTASAAPPREVVSEAPFTATSAQGAANVVQTYYALIEAKKYKEAHALWGPSSDLADATFAAPYRQYREYHAEVYAPGQIEGAAGSLYVEVPIKTYGVTLKGERFEEPGTVTLRRVNDVDGSTPAQRRWHIAKIDLPPGPH